MKNWKIEFYKLGRKIKKYQLPAGSIDRFDGPLTNNDGKINKEELVKLLDKEKLKNNGYIDFDSGNGKSQPVLRPSDSKDIADRIVSIYEDNNFKGMPYNNLRYKIPGKLHMIDLRMPDGSPRALTTPDIGFGPKQTFMGNNHWDAEAEIPHVLKDNWTRSFYEKNPTIISTVFGNDFASRLQLAGEYANAWFTNKKLEDLYNSGLMTPESVHNIAQPYITRAIGTGEGFNTLYQDVNNAYSKAYENNWPGFNVGIVGPGVVSWIGDKLLNINYKPIQNIGKTLELGGNRGVNYGVRSHDLLPEVLRFGPVRGFVDYVGNGLNDPSRGAQNISNLYDTVPENSPVKRLNKFNFAIRKGLNKLFPGKTKHEIVNGGEKVTYERSPAVKFWDWTHGIHF